MTSQEKSAKLVAVVQYFRHGERTPAADYPKDPHGEKAYWPLEKGVLTNTGIQQMYELGQFTRDRYNHFLPKFYPNKNFRIYTTMRPRTMQSAQAFNAGLFPPRNEDIWNEKIQCTPIASYIAEDYLFTFELRNIAPAYAREFKKAMDEYLEEFKKDPIAKYISSNSGVELTDYLAIGYLFDTLFTQDLLGLKLPDWTKEVYPNYKYHMDYLECVAKTDSMKRLFAGPQLYEVIQYFEKMIKDPNSGPKLITFSGHDINIVAVLETFGAFRRHIPANASSLFIELIEKNREYYVNVFYKQEDIEPIRVRGADFDCPFEHFKELLSDYAITKEQFYQECL